MQIPMVFIGEHNSGSWRWKFSILERTTHHRRLLVEKVHSHHLFSDLLILFWLVRRGFDLMQRCAWVMASESPQGISIEEFRRPQSLSMNDWIHSSSELLIADLGDMDRRKTNFSPFVEGGTLPQSLSWATRDAQISAHFLVQQGNWNQNNNDESQQIPLYYFTTNIFKNGFVGRFPERPISQLCDKAVKRECPSPNFLFLPMLVQSNQLDSHKLLALVLETTRKR